MVVIDEKMDSVNCKPTNSEYNPYEHRKVLKPSSDIRATANIIKASLGSGLLAGPLAFSNSGWAVGILGTMVVGLICGHCIHILIDKKPQLNYAETCEAAFKHGPKCLRRFSKAARTVIFAMEGIGLVMPVENAMKKPQHFLGCPSVLVVAMSAIVFFYSTLGLFGYFRYGDLARGSITLNLPIDDWPAVCAKIFIALSIFFTYPLQFYVVFDIFKRYTDPYLKDNCKNITDIGGRIVGVCLCVAIGIALPLLEQIINLVGACFYSILGLIIPGIVETVFRYNNLGKFKWVLIKNIIIVAFGLTSLISGCTVTVLDIIAILNKRTEDIRSLANLLKASLGSGILAMPLAFSNAGWGFGIIGTIIVAFICVGALFYSMLGLIIPGVVQTVFLWEDLGRYNWILWKNSLIVLFGVFCAISGCTVTVLDIIERLQSRTVAVITENVLYPSTISIDTINTKCKDRNLEESDYDPFQNRKLEHPNSIFIDWAMALTILGACAVYVILLVDSVQQIVDFYSKDNEINNTMYCLMFLVPILIFTQIKNLKYIAPFSGFANILLVLTFLICIYYICDEFPDFDSKPTSVGIDRLPLFIGTVIFAMEGIGVVLPVENTMAKPQHFLGCPGVLNITMSIVVLLYMVMGILGYLKYGNDAAGIAAAALFPRLEQVIGLEGAFFYSFLGLIAPSIIHLIFRWERGLGKFNYIIYKDIFLIVFGFFVLVTGVMQSIKEIIRTH
ncbi:unnamed protein product [Leptidea sinapis]|uniref:Amino acid transporter transmembrane domain-containing protein n=1 Tax=Leptidea sinapis TaxID=189913 RepID=A0A5E4Q306_9NEOP|nr:unnamed protein product [Leptidea sinapis]